MIADDIRISQFRAAAPAEPKCWNCSGHGLVGGGLLPAGGGIDPGEVCEICEGSGHHTCPSCNGDGWESYGLGYGDPHFRPCPSCGNPEGYPSP